MQRFTPQDYLKIDIANNFGLDKKKWDERIAWFDANESKLMELLPQADEPALFYAGVQAWEKVKAGLPIGYPISLDATSSGLQILAVLTGDRQAASLCNVVDTGDREDAYTVVYEDMLNTIGETSKISRDDTKRAIMTSLYSSKAVPKEVFGEGMLLKVFYDTMERVAPAAWELNEAFLQMWNPDAYSHDWVLPDNFHVHVKVMSQVKETVHFLNEPFEVFHMENLPMEEGRSLGANTTHSLDAMIVREITRRCDYDVGKVTRLKLEIKALKNGAVIVGKHEEDNDSKMIKILWQHYMESGYLSARILDYLHTHNIHLVDIEVIEDLLYSLPQRPFKVLSVHDCFRVLPNYGNDLREQYNLQLMLIAKSNLLQYLISQIMGRPVKIGKLDPTLWKDIMATNYALS